MANRYLVNNALLDGEYAGVTIAAEATTDVQVILADIPFTKTSNKEVWITGRLTFTITVDNSENTDPIMNGVITDELDITMFQIDTASIAGSSEIAGTVVSLVLGTDYSVSYTEDTTEQIGTLMITMMRPIAAEEKIIFSFEGDKVEP